MQNLRGFAVVLSVAAVAVLDGCSGGAGGTSPHVQFDDAQLTAHQAAIQRVARQATLIVVGTVQSVGPPPAFWSGFFESEQTVTYTVSTSVPPAKGNFAGPALTVRHVTVKGARHARTDGSIGLSPTIFTVGTQLIVMVGAPSGANAADVDEDYSTVPYTVNNLAAVQKLL